MPSSIAARLALAAGIAAVTAAPGGAWPWSACGDCEPEAPPYGHYGPAPVYTYDYGRGPIWTSNGWTYPPVHSAEPSPPPHPQTEAPPARGRNLLQQLLGLVLP